MLASYRGEWTTFNAHLQEGEFGGLQVWLGVVNIMRLYCQRVFSLIVSYGEMTISGRTLATNC